MAQPTSGSEGTKTPSFCILPRSVLTSSWTRGQPSAENRARPGDDRGLRRFLTLCWKVPALRTLSFYPPLLSPFRNARLRARLPASTAAAVPSASDRLPRINFNSFLWRFSKRPGKGTDQCPVGEDGETATPATWELAPGAPVTSLRKRRETVET